jgi:hypothetical protein
MCPLRAAIEHTFAEEGEKQELRQQWDSWRKENQASFQ